MTGLLALRIVERRWCHTVWFLAIDACKCEVIAANKKGGPTATFIDFISGLLADQFSIARYLAKS